MRNLLLSIVTQWTWLPVIQRHAWLACVLNLHSDINININNNNCAKWCYFIRSGGWRGGGVCWHWRCLCCQQQFNKRWPSCHRLPCWSDCQESSPQVWHSLLRIVSFPCNTYAVFDCACLISWWSCLQYLDTVSCTPGTLKWQLQMFSSEDPLQSQLNPPPLWQWKMGWINNKQQWRLEWTVCVCMCVCARAHVHRIFLKFLTN